MIPFKSIAEMFNLGWYRVNLRWFVVFFLMVPLCSLVLGMDLTQESGSVESCVDCPPSSGYADSNSFQLLNVTAASGWEYYD